MSNRNEINKEKICNLLILISLVLIGLFYYIPELFVSGIPHYNPEDTLFHLSRLKGLGNVWSSPVNYSSFNGKGPYVNVFYPWLTMYPMRIIYDAVGSYVFAYHIYYLLLGIATSFISYFSVKSITSNRFVSICFSILYTYSSYRFACVFRRAALGESIAIAVLPFVFSALIQILYYDFKKWYLLCISMSLLAYSHFLSLFYTGILVFVIFLICIIRSNDRTDRIISFIKAILCSFIISLGSILPIILAQGDNLIYSPEGDLQDLIDNADGIHTIMRNTIYNIPSAHSLGLVVFVSVILCIFLSVKYRKETIFSSLVFLLAGIVLMIMSSSLFPWRTLGNISLFGIIQYPWRLNAYITLFFFLSFSLLLCKLKISRAVQFVLCFSLMIFAVALNTFTYNKLRTEEEILLTDEIISNISVSYVDYSPLPAAIYLSADWNSLDSCFVNDSIAEPIRTVSNDGSTVCFAFSDVDEESIVDLPVYWFSSVRVYENGTEIDSSMSKRGTVSICLNQSGSNVIEVSNSYPSYTYVCWIISALAFLYVLCLPVRNRFKKHV